MQRDFHYYCVGVLARAAGFNNKDALVLAYASQYVDDSSESQLIPIHTGAGQIQFDPARTSYAVLEVFQTLDWSAQKRIWIPFHFLPPQPFRPEQHTTFSFITRPDSPFARMVLKQAASEPVANYKRRLCRIGVALHTYADTWAHQDFSGRKSGPENNVEGIYLYDRNQKKWEHLGIENFLFDLLVQIGHAEVGFFPDEAFQKWKCTIEPAGRAIERDNVEVFLEAAELIYNHLAKMDKLDPVSPIPFEELKPQIRNLFSLLGPQPMVMERLSLPTYRAHEAESLAERCRNWQQAFAYLFEPHPELFVYDKQAWRTQALEGDTAWDEYSAQEWDRMSARQVKAGFWDSLWVHFHRAALQQRHFVLERLP
jgi:hypothetical protein